MDAAVAWLLDRAFEMSPQTSLPTQPYDTMPCCLVDSTTAPTYAWVLQYSAAMAKWLWMGGTPMYASVDTADSSTGGNNVYSDPSTHAGPSLTVPRAGVYIVEYGGRGNGNASATTSYIGVSVAGSTPTLGTDRTSIPIGNSDSNSSSSQFQTGSIAASSVIKQQIADADTTRRISMSLRWLTVRPFTVT